MPSLKFVWTQRDKEREVERITADDVGDMSMCLDFSEETKD